MTQAIMNDQAPDSPHWWAAQVIAPPGSKNPFGSSQQRGAVTAAARALRCASNAEEVG